MREAPSTVIASRLLAEGATVRTWDPLAQPDDGEPWASTTRHLTPDEAMTGADAALIVTEWPQSREASWERARTVMRRPLVFDGRNTLEPATMATRGLTSMSVGRRTVGG